MLRTNSLVSRFALVIEQWPIDVDVDDIGVDQT